MATTTVNRGRETGVMHHTPEPLKYKPVIQTLEIPNLDGMAEYVAVAKAVGIAPPALAVEQFKQWLRNSGMTVFELESVVKFMDAKSAAEGTGWGWMWKSLRGKDSKNIKTFGTAASRNSPFRFPLMYDFERDEVVRNNRNSEIVATDYFDPNTAAYEHDVPLHALKKVAKIEKEFDGDVRFFVSDYAPAPQRAPDPFLMALVPNPRVASGIGRFVIDVWDEPGFGIEQMLKSDV